MRKIYFILFFAVSIVGRINAQKSSNPISLFKMMLFLDKDNVTFRGMDPHIQKDDSLFRVFSETLNITLDTLNFRNNGRTLKFTSKYTFYKLDAYKITTVRPLKGEEGQFIGVDIGKCSNYVAAINVFTGICYKLQGFRDNDFVSFLTDFKDDYKEEVNEILKNKTFFKKFKVEGLDFICLYQGLRAKNMDKKKYPCLIRCSDPFEAHAPINARD